MRTYVRLSLITLLLGAVAFAQESLGDAARRARVSKKPSTAKVITNDDLKTAASFNNGSARKETPSNSGSEDKDVKTDKTVSPKGESGDKTASAEKSGDNKEKKDEFLSTEDVKKRDAEYRERYLDQKKSVELLGRELYVLEREYQIQTAALYADAGNAFRDEKKWGETRKKYDDDIAAKRKQLDEAKQKLEDMKEDGRRAGVAPRAFED